LKPFNSSINILAPNMYFLGLLIMSSPYYDRRRYLYANWILIASILGSIYLGSSYGL